MRKNTKPLLLLIGIFFSLLAGILIGRGLHYKNSPALDHLTSLSRQDKTMVVVPTSTVSEPADSSEKTLSQRSPQQLASIEETGWMKFGGLNLLEDNISFRFAPGCESGSSVVIPAIQIIPWHETVFEDGEFGIGKNLAVGWEHLGHDGLWIHSGWDFWLERSPATDLQYYLETDALNEILPLERIQYQLGNCLLGSQVKLEQSQQNLETKVTAAVRVAATGVDELSRHTMDLVPYLAQAYPDSGFADLGEDTLLIYFCGRAALDERTDPDAGYWTQTRYIIALEPTE